MSKPGVVPAVRELLPVGGGKGRLETSSFICNECAQRMDLGLPRGNEWKTHTEKAKYVVRFPSRKLLPFAALP